MYDNVNLRLPIEEAGGVDLLRDIPARLTRCSWMAFEDGNRCISGNLGTLKVKVSNLGLMVKDSSLCKWYLGDNFQGLSRGDTRHSIEKLSDELQLPMSRAKVTRIDLAANLIMKEHKQSYFNHLGNLQHYNRLQQPNGLYYTNKLRTLLFYEKVHEQAEKRKPIQEMYRGRQVLRYEMRFKGRLLQSFNLPELRAEMLYDPNFYVGIINRWKNEYHRISKIQDIQIDYSMVKTKKDQANQAILFYVTQRGGELNVIAEISEAYKRGDLTKKQAHDLRAQVGEACRYQPMTSTSEAIQELDKKVNEAARFYL